MYRKYLVMPIVVLALISGGKAEGSKKFTKDLNFKDKPSKVNKAVNKVVNDSQDAFVDVPKNKVNSEKDTNESLVFKSAHELKGEVIWEGYKPTKAVPYNQPFKQLPRYKNIKIIPGWGLASFELEGEDDLKLTKPEIVKMPDNKGTVIIFKNEDDKTSRQNNNDRTNNNNHKSSNSLNFESNTENQH